MKFYFSDDIVDYYDYYNEHELDISYNPHELGYRLEYGGLEIITWEDRSGDQSHPETGL